MKDQERFPENVQHRAGGMPSPYGMWGQLEKMHREINRLFEETITPFREGNLFSPFNHKIEEEGDNLIVTMELPDIYVQDIEIDAVENYITVRAEHKEEHKGDEKERHYSERRYGRFQSTLPLPKKVRPEAAEASYENNILRITLPKKEEKQQNTFRINVKRPPH